MDQMIGRKPMRSHPLPQPEPAVETMVSVYNFILAVHDALFSDIFHHEAHLFGHGKIAVFKQLHIAEVTVHLPRNDVHCRTPAYSAATSRLPWRGISHMACLHILGIAHVTQPFVVECVAVIVGHDCLAAHLTVSSVWRFLAMRTVTHHTSVKIVFKTSSPDGIDLIKQRI